jgi:hypothetical protein
MAQTIKEVKKRLAEALETFGPTGRPGKFEGEGEDTMYFYSVLLDGFGEEMGIEGEMYSVFDVDAAERKVLDLDSDVVKFVIAESDQGFVSGSAMNKQRYDQFYADVSELEESAGEGYYA